MKYEVIIYWSEEDKSFIAEMPGLPGCAADGHTKAEALKAIEEVAALWIKAAKSLGRPVPKPRGKEGLVVLRERDYKKLLAQIGTEHKLDAGDAAESRRRMKKPGGTTLAQLKKKLAY